MINHGAKWHHGSAVGTRTWATHQPPVALLLVLLDLIIRDFHIAAFQLTLMQGLLDNSQGKEACSLTHGNPTGGAGQQSLPLRVSLSDDYKKVECFSHHNSSVEGSSVERIFAL